MILDIRYFSKPPEQIQNVRRISYYPHYHHITDMGNVSAEIIVYSIHDDISPRYIPIDEIKEMWTTND